jgi:hypothetical protein
MMRTSYEGVPEVDVPRPVLRLVGDLDGKHVDGHNRLRIEHDRYEERLQDIERTSASHTTQLLGIGKRTTDVSMLRFTPAMFVATLGICASIIGGSYASTWGLRDNAALMAKDIASIKTTMEAQQETRKTAEKLEDERNARIVKDIGDIKAQQSMQDLKMNNLRETVLTNQRR